MEISDPNLNAAIELHDSHLASISRENSAILVVLAPAYVHRSKGLPGVNPGTGWLQDIILYIDSASIEGENAELPCELSEGRLRVDEEAYENVLPIPLDRIGKIELVLALNNGAVVTIRGTQIKVRLLGAARYLEDFS